MNYLSRWEYVVSQETARRKHQHWYISIPEHERKLFHDWLKAEINVEGNASFAWTKSAKEEVDDEIKYIAYIIKDGRYEYNGHINHIIETANKFNQDRKEAKPTDRVIDRLRVYIEKRRADPKDPSYKYNEDIISHYIRLIVDFHVENDTMIRMSQIQSYLETILANNEFFKNQFIKKILSRYEERTN